MKSRIHRSEVVANRERKFGADGIYYPVVIVDNTGERRALFTAEQMDAAVARAEANPEDWPK